MHRIFTLACALSLATFACDAAPVDTKPDPDPDPDPAPTGWFASSPPNSGPRVWLEAVADDDHHLAVYGAELGDVLGWSLHVRHDASAVTLDGATLGGFLGDATQSAQLAERREAEVRLAEVRRSPEQGPVAIDAVTKLATVEVTHASADAAIDLAAVIVRRIDGAYVSVQIAGGVVVAEVQP